VTAEGSGALAALTAREPLEGAALKSCCAAVYAHPAVRWLLSEELHPGGAEATRRALEMARLREHDNLLDVASGSGASALLAARERGATVVAIEYGADAVREAADAASAAGLGGRVSFVQGDAEALPVDDSSFDVALCECSLCTFPDKRQAVAELHRVLRPGGRLALSDVVVSEGSLPTELRSGLATIACVGSALSREGYERLLAEAGFELVETESCREDAARLAERVEERLRGARLLGFGSLAELPLSVEEALAAVHAAREAIAEGALGYAIFSAVRRG
jgi:arsenite methyltransferase